MVTSNFMVDPDSFALAGMVDWAEADVLPFGTCFYGLEHLLGYLASTATARYEYRYYTWSDALRQIFWRKLVDMVPTLVDARLLNAVILAKRVGTLLWFGFAWENSAVSRVVDCDRDPVEVQCLELFLRRDWDEEACRSLMR